MVMTVDFESTSLGSIPSKTLLEKLNFKFFYLNKC